MSTFVSVKTKSGAYFYYKLVKGKKVRVPMSEVPENMKATAEKPAKKVSKSKKEAVKPAVEKKTKVVKKPVVEKKTVKKPEKGVVEKKTTTQCLKVASLRKETKDKSVTLKKWMEDPQNIYVGRQGRIFIGTGEDKAIFHYKGSKFANPYKVGNKEGEYTLEASIKLYKAYLKEKGLIEKAKNELKGKNLGCFCDQKGPCHAKVLADVANEV